MKRLLLVLFFTAAAALLPSGSRFVCAQEDQSGNLPSVDMGIMPDSHFYFLDKLGKSLNLLFTIGPDAKTQKVLGYARERLAEAVAMADRNKTGPAAIAISGYQHFIAIAVKQADAARKILVTDLDEEVAYAITTYMEAIDAIEDKLVYPAPQKAVDSILAARESSITYLTIVVKGLALDKPELAVEIDLKAAESRLKRANFLAEKNDPDGVRKAVIDWEKLFTFSSQIAAAAREFNSGAAAVEACLNRSKTIQFDLLTTLNANIMPQAPASVKAKIEDALKNAAERISIKR